MAIRLVFLPTAVSRNQRPAETGEAATGRKALFLMRWLMLALLVSLGALLFAAAGVVRHIRLHHRQDRKRPAEPVEETEAELER